MKRSLQKLGRAFAERGDQHDTEADGGHVKGLIETKADDKAR